MQVLCEEGVGCYAATTDLSCSVALIAMLLVPFQPLAVAMRPVEATEVSNLAGHQLSIM